MTRKSTTACSHTCNPPVGVNFWCVDCWFNKWTVRTDKMVPCEPINKPTCVPGKNINRFISSQQTMDNIILVHNTPSVGTF